MEFGRTVWVADLEDSKGSAQELVISEIPDHEIQHVVIFQPFLNPKFCQFKHRAPPARPGNLRHLFKMGLLRVSRTFELDFPFCKAQRLALRIICGKDWQVRCDLTQNDPVPPENVGLFV